MTEMYDLRVQIEELRDMARNAYQMTYDVENNTDSGKAKEELLRCLDELRELKQEYLDFKIYATDKIINCTCKNKVDGDMLEIIQKIGKVPKTFIKDVK